MDIGKWELIESKGNRQTYYGVSSEANLLPNLIFDELESGSVAFCVDNGDVYIYHEQTKQWHKQ